jgi:predicted site-specific integrase-resolvase
MAHVFSFLGGISFGAVVTAVVSWIMTKRQEVMEILNIISNAAPYYNKVYYYYQLSSYGDLAFSELPNSSVKQPICQIKIIT